MKFLEKIKLYWENNKQRYRPYLLFTFVIYMCFVLSTFLVGFTIVAGDTIETGVFLFSQIKNFEKNGQVLPSLYGDELRDKQTFEEYNTFFNKSILDYKDYIEKNYFYNETSGYDCKYWTTIHYLYYSYNQERYNLKFKTVTTDNHIFALIYNDTSYCLFDGQNIDCYQERGVYYG